MSIFASEVTNSSKCWNANSSQTKHWLFGCGQGYLYLANQFREFTFHNFKLAFDIETKVSLKNIHIYAVTH